MSECFKVFYVKLYVHSLVNELKWLIIHFVCRNIRRGFTHLIALHTNWETLSSVEAIMIPF